MKSFSAFILSAILVFSFATNVYAQEAESIWLVADSTSYKTGETVKVTVQANSVVPIQGFTFQIRYDPACLQPAKAVSSVSGMNGLSLPQTAGLVDASFASTTPQTINGALASVAFTALKECQTSLTLESAALAVRNESGFAAPLPGIKLGASSIALNISAEIGVTSQDAQADSGSALQLAPEGSVPSRAIPSWTMILLLVVGVAVIGFGALKLLPRNSAAVQKKSISLQAAYLQFKRGPFAGKSFALNKLPCVIGRDPGTDICLDDPNISSKHVQIFSSNNGYYLMDLGGETYLNGQRVQRSSVALKSGDVVRLGKSALFTFGS